VNDYLVRSLASPLEVVGDGRTVVGTIAPYGQVATVDDGFGAYREVIERGAFAKVMRGRPQFVRLHLEHQGEWVGRGDRWLDTDDGLAMAFRLDDTEPGRTAAYKLADGQVPGFSIGYVPGRTATRLGPDGPVEHRLSIRTLHHVALCPEGCYPEAQVTAVRSAVPGNDRVAVWQAWLDAQEK
jgi:HK97 family phage prohead protease